ncbi:peptidase U32 family protein [Methanocaldococcus infernus]
MNKPELLAPAGDLTCLVTAFKYGADAVYCGLKELSMRANAKNFTREELKEGVKIAKDLDKKVYLCLNTVIYEDQLKKAYEILDFANSIEVDAVILTDISLMEIAKEFLEVHASVQCNITNSFLAKFYSKYCKRVILSRELSLSQIREIRENLKKDKVDLELEGFVHGSLCVAISGRCFLSSYLFNKHANCGECLQPCRRRWKLINEHFDGTYELVCEGKYLLSPKDLCMIEHIPELMEVLDSFKIEGRAKNADYVMRVTKIYREAIDSVFDNTYYEKLNYFKKELNKIYNRGYDTGFYFRDKPDFQYEREGNISNYRKVEIGRVVNYYKKIGVAEIELYGSLKVGDTILIIGKTTGCVEEKVEEMQINHKFVDKAERCRVGVKVKNRVREGDKVYLLKKLN